MNLPVVLSKVRAAFAVAVLAALSALATYVAEINWDGLGPWGPAAGAFVAAVVAYARRDKFLTSLMARLEDYRVELDGYATDGTGEGSGD